MSDSKPCLLPPHMSGRAPTADAVVADLEKLSHINTYGNLPTHYLDYSFSCLDCGSTEVWKAEQQKWYYEEAKGHIWAVAQRCRTCRKKRQSGGIQHGI